MKMLYVACAAAVLFTACADRNPLSSTADTSIEYRAGKPIVSESVAGLPEPRIPAQFTVRIENIGTVLAPGAWVAQRGGMPFFTDGRPDRGAGLEALAEDGTPAELAASLPTNSGVFTTPIGADGPGPLTPDNAYEFSFVARPGDRLSFATMYVQSNDLFLAPGDTGIALFTDDQPISGDITDQIELWDAGTEVNEEPGVGENQAPRQAGANTGIDEGGVVRLVDDGFTYPAVPDIVRITITSAGGASGETGEDEGEGDGHDADEGDSEGDMDGGDTDTDDDADTDDGDADTDDDDGDANTDDGDGDADTDDGDADTDDGDADTNDDMDAADDIDADGLTIAGPVAGLPEPRVPAQFTVRIENIGTVLAPGAWVAQRGGMPFFTDGRPDRGAGLEALAEDGTPAELAASLPTNSGVFTTPVGADGPGPLTPDNAYEFSFVARPGDRLSFATMYVQSNDLFLAPGDTGIALFTDDSQPISGDITDQIELWDAGTEVNEEPGVGENQAPRQAGANTGIDEGGVVRLVDDGFTYPAVPDIVRITITSIRL